MIFDNFGQTYLHSLVHWKTLKIIISKLTTEQQDWVKCFEEQKDRFGLPIGCLSTKLTGPLMAVDAHSHLHHLMSYKLNLEELEVLYSGNIALHAQPRSLMFPTTNHTILKKNPPIKYKKLSVEYPWYNIYDPYSCTTNDNSKYEVYVVNIYANYAENICEIYFVPRGPVVKPIILVLTSDSHLTTHWKIETPVKLTKCCMDSWYPASVLKECFDCPLMNQQLTASPSGVQTDFWTQWSCCTKTCNTGTQSGCRYNNSLHKFEYEEQYCNTQYCQGIGNVFFVLS
ncbi:C6 [Mytilus coruscus]|uniref:C6 n=1 Tax=Mytilus coruscus TaxID=42192 RepID=A0A6J8AZ36_MYTCO|nr:C6 [Mytilus coruscus]